MTPRRLLFYTHGLVGGGAERVWALLASGLRARGHAVAFAVDFEADANRAFLDPAIPVAVLGRGHLRGTRRLAALLRDGQPEVAFAAVGASNLKLLAARTLSRVPLRVVASAHGKLDAEYGRLGRATYRLTPATSRWADRTVAVSGTLRRYLVERFGADPRRTVAIPNPVRLPPPEVVPDAAALAGRPGKMLALGRLVPEKGFDTLLRAVALSALAPALDLLGEGPERPRLERLASELGIAGRVRFGGYVPEPWQAFADARLLVSPSTTEAFGNVLVEALAFGLPVVATRSGGPEEILDEGRFGRLVPVGDPPALAAAIDAALREPGDPARHRARAEAFSLDLALDRYEALIEGMLRERAAA